MEKLGLKPDIQHFLPIQLELVDFFSLFFFLFNLIE
jgi:hypothetical protein